MDRWDNQTPTLAEVLQHNQDLFNFDFPFPAHHRETFIKKFIDYYLWHNIGFYSVNQFKQRLQAHINLRMPYYLALYRSEFMLKNPFDNYRLMTTINTKEDEDILNKDLTYMTMYVDTLNNANTSTSQDFTAHRDIVTHKQGEEDSTNDIVGTEDSLKHEVTHTTDNTVTDKEEVNSGQDNLHDDDSYTKTPPIQTSMTRDGENERFADTPQINFVTGSGHYENGIWVPDSDYSTTVTRRDTTEAYGYNTTTETYTETDPEKTTTYGKQVNTQTISNETVDTDKNTDYTEQTTGNTVYHEATTNDLDTDQDDITHTLGKENTNTTIDTKTGKSEAATNINERDKELDTFIDSRGYMNANLPRLLQQYRETFINIDEMLINELGVLFLQVY